LVGKCFDDAFARQGFAAREIVTRWQEIVGEEIATHAEPMKMQWPHQFDNDTAGPATLVLRVEGPAAIEIQHLSGLVIERVNQFLGWQAVDRLALRQAPLKRRKPRTPRPTIDPEAAERVAATLTSVTDEPLRAALGRLGAAVKRM
jgi:hypothetical protein